MNRIDAVILDLDGTMVDSEPASRLVWSQLIAGYGAQFTDEDYLAIVGQRTDESAVYIQARYQLPVTPAALLGQKNAIWSTVWRRGLPARPGLAELIAALAERDVPWGVATASPRHYAETVLRQLGYDAACRALAGGDEVAESKPDPAVYLLAAERLGAAPAHCLVVEDSVPGMQAGLNAGMTVVAIPTPYTDLRALPAVHYQLGSLAEVPALLDG